MTGNSFNWCCNRRLGIQDYREAITHDHKMLSFMLLRRKKDAVFLFIMIDAGLLNCLVCVCAEEMSLPWRMSGLSLRERVRISVSQKWFGAELIFLHIKWSQLKWLRQLTRCLLDTSEVKCFKDILQEGHSGADPRQTVEIMSKCQCQSLPQARGGSCETEVWTSLRGELLLWPRTRI